MKHYRRWVKRKDVSDEAVERPRHLKTGSPEHTAWKNMIQRCTNPRAQWYHRYGARGIAVCDRWLKFANFLADMGARPSPKHTIERIDNDGPYSPENCRWATWAEQNANRVNGNSAKTHCKRGHEFTPENTYISKNRFGRICRSCQRIRAKRRHMLPPS